MQRIAQDFKKCITVILQSLDIFRFSKDAPWLSLGFRALLWEPRENQRPQFLFVFSLPPAASLSRERQGLRGRDKFNEPSSRFPCVPSSSRKTGGKKLFPSSAASSFPGVSYSHSALHFLTRGSNNSPKASSPLSLLLPSTV